VFKRYLVAALCLSFLTACPALAAGSFEPAVLNAQVLLDRAGFSPGIIDGRRGGQLDLALKAFQTSRGLRPTGVFDEETNALLAADKRPAVIRLMITREDVEGPFVTIPAKLEDQADLPALGYASLLEMLCERYHTSPNAIAALNPRMTSLEAGVSLLLPNVATDDRDYPDRLNPIWRNTLAGLNVSATQPQAAMVVVDGSEGVLRAYDKAGKIIAQFPATMGSSHDPLPVGEWKILGASYNPVFHYNASLFWDADDKAAKAVLPPGPNGPAGVVWIDLDKPHYGIHGTPEPTRIGRSESHGCIRLTNWDAARLSLMVRPGTPAIFQE
jgi:lipoprotein-anchoring transpeptidase ErfK/SrfK